MCFVLLAACLSYLALVFYPYSKVVLSEVFLVRRLSCDEPPCSTVKFPDNQLQSHSIPLTQKVETDLLCIQRQVVFLLVYEGAAI